MIGRLQLAGDGRLSLQGPVHRPLHRPEHHRRLTEAHLRLGGVHIHIHHLRRHLDKQRRNRITPGHQQGVIRLNHSVGEIAVLDVTPIDEQLDVAAVAPVQAGRAGEATDADIGRGGIIQRLHRQHLPGDVGAIDLDHCGHSVAVAGRLKAQPPLGHIAKPHLGISQGVAGDDLADMTRLGGVGAQEFLARGRVPEEMLDGDTGAGRRANGPLADEPAPFQLDLHPRGRLSRAGDQRRLADRADSRQRLAPKSQRGDVLQLIRRLDFGGGVPLEGQGRLIRRDAAAVVDDANQAFAALSDLHADVGGAGIKAVFDELLHHRSRALNHLARGDLVGNIWGQYVNGHKAIINVWRLEGEVGMRIIFAHWRDRAG